MLKILDKLIPVISIMFVLSTIVFFVSTFVIVFAIGFVIVLITLPFNIGRKHAKKSS